MRQWTQAEKDRQSSLIRSWAPWSHSTGPKTSEGKDKSKMNAYKHGDYNAESNWLAVDENAENP
jgi:hypothetical protein